MIRHATEYNPAMSWLATLDARSTKWSVPNRWLYLAVKWSLIGLGGFLWVMLWYERHPALGLIQVGVLAYVIWTHWPFTASHPAPTPDSAPKP